MVPVKLAPAVRIEQITLGMEASVAVITGAAPRGDKTLAVVDSTDLATRTGLDRG